MGDTQIEFLGAKVLPPQGRRGGGFTIVRSWPPVSTPGIPFDEATLVDARGAVVEPDGGDPAAASGLLIGMRIDSIGVFERAGIRIDYSIGEDRFTAFFEVEAGFCVAEDGRKAKDPCGDRVEQQG